MLKQIFCTALLSLTMSALSADLSSELKLRERINPMKMYSKDEIDAINPANTILALQGQIYLKIYLRDNQKRIIDFCAVMTPLSESIGNMIAVTKQGLGLNESDKYRLSPWCTSVVRRAVIMPIPKNWPIVDAVNENKTIHFILEKENQ